MTPEPQHIWLPELGYFVVATPSELTGHAGDDHLSVDFDIYEASETAAGLVFRASCAGPVYEPNEESFVAKGYIRFDECSNWKFADHYIHFCNRDDPLKLATAMTACYDHAKELFGGFC